MHPLTTSLSPRPHPLRSGRGVVRLGLVLALAVLGAAPPAIEPDADLIEAERALREAKVGTEGPALLAFFRARTLSGADRMRLAAAARLIGDDSFEVREKASADLVRAGWAARPFLIEARKSADLEVIRRAEHCLRRIEANTETALTVAAARALMARRPAGAVETLLAYLPAALADEAVEESVFLALTTLGVKTGKPHPALVKALTDPAPTRRAAAAHVLGRSAPEQRLAVRRLLTDAEPTVRLRAASALALAGDRTAMPALIALLAEGPEAQARQAEDLLFQVAGDKGPSVSLVQGSVEERRKCRTEWEGWWRTHGAKIDLSHLSTGSALQGLTVVCDCDVGGKSRAGLLWACRSDGSVRWKIDTVSNPADVQFLPGGRYLVAECMGQVFTERDRNGKVLWQHKVDNYPVSCQRLPNGNTFLATYAEISEVTPAGKVLYTHAKGGSVFCAEKLRNGNILYAHSDGRIVEMDTKGKEVRAVNVGGLGSWAGVEPLPGGRYLVAQYAMNRVVEVNSRGGVLWKCEVQTPAWATRLRNGNTLVASPDGRRVVEFNRAGKEVWKQATKGRPFRVRRL